MTILVGKIVSGGQTGADRGGLDAAIEIGIPHGGWCPKGRRAEDGAIPERYELQETSSADYKVRTRRNVIDSDGTVIFTRGRLEGGSKLTEKIAREAGKPCVHQDLDKVRLTEAVQQLRAWLRVHEVHVLNVAGSRESKAPGLQVAVARLLVSALQFAADSYQPEEERVFVDDVPELVAADPAEAYKPYPEK